MSVATVMTAEEYRLRINCAKAAVKMAEDELAKTLRNAPVFVVGHLWLRLEDDGDLSVSVGTVCFNFLNDRDIEAFVQWIVRVYRRQALAALELDVPPAGESAGC